MLDNIVIRVPEEYDNGPIISMSLEDSAKISEKLKELDELWHIELNNIVRENSYDNNDYLFVSNLLQSIRELHKKIYFHPTDKKWIRGHTEIPYIHLDFVEELAAIEDEWGNWIPDDKQLNMGVKPASDNGSHRMWCNYYLLKRYIIFLQKVFDNNEEIVISLPKDSKIQVPVEYKNKDEIVRIAIELEQKGLKEQAECLLAYANSFLDCEKIKMPFLCFIRVPEEKEVATWVFSDSNLNTINIPMKKTIYNTSGFAHLFEERKTLISELFINSLKMLLAHETAHVARGHWLLRKNEPEYSQQRIVMMNCEINADWTAAYWILNELLYDTIDGNPYSNKLIYTRDTLIHIISIRILSVYLSLSWKQKEEGDRNWTEETLDSFLKNTIATHPVYQFRLYNVLNQIKRHLEHMSKKCKEYDYALKTADDIPLDEELFDDVWNRSCDMIFSFEYAFRTYYNEDTRESLEKIREGLVIVKNAIPDNKEEVPFFMCHMEKAQNELAEYEKEWPEILDKLRGYGMFYRM